jgi:hypothetical protein
MAREPDDLNWIEGLTFQVGDAPRVVVRTFNGRVELLSGDPGVVRAEATIRNPSRVAYAVSQSGNTITVQAIGKSAFSLFGAFAGVDVVITAPAATALDVETNNGRIEVDGFTRGGELVTSNGKVEVTRSGGDLSVKTTNGKVTVERFSGKAHLKTSNRQIVLDDVMGTFDAQTTNGRVTFGGELEAGGENWIKSTNGGVAVVLGGKPSVRLDASTSNGRVKSSLPIAATTTKRSHLVGTIGDGEANLEVRTSNGSVTIK